VPAGASPNAQNTVTLSAAFNYTNATPALGISTVVATDVTTVGSAGNLVLRKTVVNLTQPNGTNRSVAARPGDTVWYLTIATNNGSEPLTTLVVSDSVPPFTSFVSAVCGPNGNPITQPPGMTCSVTKQPAVGAKEGVIEWTFTGALPPTGTLSTNPLRQASVNFRVKVDE
jgi:uncharacterized repeat protein (TIGR01451 family)